MNKRSKLFFAGMLLFLICGAGAVWPWQGIENEQYPGTERRMDLEQKEAFEPGEADGLAEDTGEVEDAEDIEDRIDEIVAGMTLEEKTAQLFFVTPEALTGQGNVTAAGDVTREAFGTYPVGGLIYFAGNLQTSEQVKELTSGQQAVSMERIGLPLFIGIDEEGGKVARIANESSIRVKHFPNMQEIGASSDAALKAEEIGNTIGAYLNELGINLDFAPVADVLSNPENTVVKERSFGSDARKTAELATEFARSLERKGVYSCMKHFPGHGATAEDSHKGFAYTDKTKEELMEEDWIPFQEGIAAGISFLMAGHISAPKITGEDTPASLSEILMTDILRKELSFDGIVITDAMNMGAVSHAYSSAEAAELAVKAGVDMLLMPVDFKEAYEGLLEAVHAGRIPEERIDVSVRRIVVQKMRLDTVTGSLKSH